MNQQWYIKDKNFHRGPFSKEQMLSFIETDEILPETIVWTPGQADWKCLDEVEEFVGYFPPDFGPEVQKDLYSLDAKDLYDGLDQQVRISAPVRKVATVRPEESKVEAPSIAKQNGLLESKSIEEVQLSELNVSEVGEEVQIEQTVTNKKKVYRPGFFSSLFMLIVVGGLSFFGYQVYDWKSSQRAPEGLSQKGHQKLSKVFQYFPWENMKYTWYFDNVENVLWLATNKSEKMQYDVKIKSIKGQIAGLSDVVMNAKASFQNHYAQIDTFEFVKGTKVYSGLYDVSFIPSGRVDAKGFDLKIYIGDTDPKVVANKVSLYKLKLKEYSQEVRLSLNEEYKSLLSIIKSTEGLIKETFPKFKRGTHYKRYFESEYGKNVSQRLNNLMVDNKTIRSQFQLDYVNLKHEFDTVFGHAEKFGEFIISMSKEIRPRNRITRRKRAQLESFYLEKLRLMKQEIYQSYKKSTKVDLLSI